MKVKVIPVTPFQQNCTLLICEQSNKAAIVDPGGDIDTILREVAAEGVEVEKILLTHGHLDHVGGTQPLARELSKPVIGPHKDDAFWLDQLEQQSQMFGFPRTESFKPDQWLEEGETVQVGELSLEVLHVPGHTPGHIVFFEPKSQILIAGDILFRGSIGRTDFPMGDFDTLIRGIKGKLWQLPEATRVIPGHGPATTIGNEMRSNPFVR